MDFIYGSEHRIPIYPKYKLAKTVQGVFVLSYVRKKQDGIWYLSLVRESFYPNRTTDEIHSVCIAIERFITSVNYVLLHGEINIEKANLSDVLITDPNQLNNI